jgi:hypothetical protein
VIFPNHPCRSGLLVGTLTFPMPMETPPAPMLVTVDAPAETAATVAADAPKVTSPIALEAAHSTVVKTASPIRSEGRGVGR